MDVQQLSSKVATLEAKVATLEDEGKIIKGEVKQVLTEIRTAVLARDNPFDDGNAGRTQPAPVPVMAEIARVQIVTPEPVHEAAPEPVLQPPARVAQHFEPAPEPREPTMLRTAAPPAPPQPEQPQWTLLTIASISAWAEEAMIRLGALRFEILLDLCEAAGHVTPEARAALSRIKELDVQPPSGAPSTNDTVVILRQLDALLNDEYEPQQGFRAASRR